MRFHRPSLISFLAAVLLSAGAQAQETRLASPQGRYEASGIEKFLLGSGYRDLWSLEFEVPVLDLSTFAGGLTPLRRGGGLQTTSLRLQSEEGPVYNFRSIDKDVSRGLEEILRGTLVQEIRQDQIGMLFPLSAMVVAPLLREAGVLHADPTLIVMPDDPALGEFREDFAGLLGWIEVRPDEGPDGEPGFAGSTRVVGSPRFFERLEESSRNRMSGRTFLRARLMDLYVGDWDRHPDQWRWAAFEQGDSVYWEPVPRDRDWALSRPGGFLLGLGRPLVIGYEGFHYDGYGRLLGTIWNARRLDRQLLSDLDRDDFASVARELQEALTDDVIAEAVGRLPAEYRAEIGDRMLDGLTVRRDLLMSAAMEYYEILAGWVDVRTTDDDELAEITRHPDGSVDVRITVEEDNYPASLQPLYERRFLPDETREVRIFMRGGRDAIRTSGSGPDDIKVRVIGGGGADRYTDDARIGGLYIYDGRGNNTFADDLEAPVDERRYEEPPDYESPTEQSKPRDWGSRWWRYPIFTANTDINFEVGSVGYRDTYGFRHYPFETRLRYQFMVSPTRLGASGRVSYEFPLSTTGPRVVVDVEGDSKAESYFFGFGNETSAVGPRQRYRADLGRVEGGFQFRLPRPRDGVYEPAVQMDIGPRFYFSEPVDRAVDFDPQAEGEDPRLLTELDPYGASAFSRLGLTGSFRLDTRNVRGLASSGGTVSVEGRWFPSIFDVESAYGGLRAAASWNVELGGPVLSVRGSAEKVWGSYPYFDGAALGGMTTLRGYDRRRFLGDEAVMGSAQLRLPLGRSSVLLPIRWGVHGLVDAGRVWLDGEDADDIHTAWGGGIWGAVINDHYGFGLTVARGDSRTSFYVTLGFAY